MRITQLTPILVAGADALFECNTFGSRPMPIIYWLFDGNRYDTRIHGKFLPIFHIIHFFVVDRKLVEIVCVCVYSFKLFMHVVLIFVIFSARLF